MVRDKVRILREAAALGSMVRKLCEQASEDAFEDMSYIPMLWERYEELAKDRPSLKGKGTFARGRFLFVIVLMYSPEFIIGGQMRKGLRGYIADTMGYRDNSTISAYAKRAVDDYDTYRQFREDVQFVWDDFMKRMGG